MNVVAVDSAGVPPWDATAALMAAVYLITTTLRVTVGDSWTR